MRSRWLGLFVILLALLSAFATPVRAQECGITSCPPPCGPTQPTGCANAIAQNRNVIIYDGSFTPSKIEARWRMWLVFQNVDGGEHTVTDIGCIDPNPTPCLFDVKIHPGDYLTRARSININDKQFVPNQAYLYRCRIHPEMSGAFTVVDGFPIL